MSISAPENPAPRRFRVALSFPGEHRAFVEQVAEHLAYAVGRNRVLYDKWFEAEFARTDLDIHLQRLYHDESELIAVFLCEEYERKDWCGLEWRAIRDLIKRRRDIVMPLRFDNTEIPGLFSTDGYIWIGDRSPEDIADLILQRLRDNAAGNSLSPSPGAVTAVASEPAPEQLHEQAKMLAESLAGADIDPGLRRSLAWLARKMKQQGLELFEIEKLQPAWLSSTPQRWLYALLSRGLAGALMTVPASWFFPYPFLPLCGTAAGLVVGLIDALPIWPDSRQDLKFSLLHGVMVGASTCSVLILIPWYRIDTPLGLSVSLALLFALVFGSRPTGLTADTRLYGHIQFGWSWKGLLVGFGGAFAGVTGLVVLSRPFIRFAGGLEDLPFRFWLALSVMLSVITALLGGFLGGLRGSVRHFGRHSGLGIRQDLSNGLQVFWRVAVVITFVDVIISLYLFLIGSQSGPPEAAKVLEILGHALAPGIALGLYAGFWFSGLDALQHLILRGLLGLTGQLPWRWARFLDGAVKQGLLERVEGGYRFRHGISDHFASLSERSEEAAGG
jgi:hypothetical protein